MREMIAPHLKEELLYLKSEMNLGLKIDDLMNPVSKFGDSSVDTRLKCNPTTNAPTYDTNQIPSAILAFEYKRSTYQIEK